MDRAGLEVAQSIGGRSLAKLWLRTRGRNGGHQARRRRIAAVPKALMATAHFSKIQHSRAYAVIVATAPRRLLRQRNQASRASAGSLGGGRCGLRAAAASSDERWAVPGAGYSFGERTSPEAPRLEAIRGADRQTAPAESGTARSARWTERARASASGR